MYCILTSDFIVVQSVYTFRKHTKYKSIATNNHVIGSIYKGSVNKKNSKNLSVKTSLLFQIHKRLTKDI